MNKIETKFRSFYGRTLWKTEESKRLTAIVFWLLTLSGIYAPFITKELADLGVVGVSGWILIPLLMVIGFIAIVLFGHLIAKTKLWQDDWRARIQKNPFETHLIRPKERKIMENQLKIFKGLKGKDYDHRFEEAIKELEGWIEKGEVK